MATVNDPPSPAPPIRILLADDHEVVRQGFRAMIAGEPGWQVCAEAANGRDAVALAEKHQPDVAVLDYSMPGLNGVEAVRQIKKAVPGCEVVMLSGSEAESLVRQALEAGARSFIAKTDAREHLLAAVRAVAVRRPYFTARVSEVIMARFISAERPRSADPAHSISGREREILQLVAEGKSNKELAEILGISNRTAETHRASLMRKLELHSVADIVRYAIRHHIIEA